MQKDVLKEIFEILQGGVKWVKWNLWVADMRIYCRWCRGVCVLRIYQLFFTPPPARRWTAAIMGADRDQIAIGPLTIDSDPLSTAFLIMHLNILV